MKTYDISRSRAEILLKLSGLKAIFSLRPLLSGLRLQGATNDILSQFAFSRREKYYNNLMENSTGAVVGVDVRTGEPTFVTSSIHEVPGNRVEHVVGKSFGFLITTQSKRVILDLLDLVVKSGRLENDRFGLILVEHCGETRVIGVVRQVSAGKDGKSQELGIKTRDISGRNKSAFALMEQAYRDEPTGMIN